MGRLSADRATPDQAVARMQGALAEARLSDAAAIYDRRPLQAPDAALLRARIALKQQQPREAMQLLLRLKNLEPVREAERLMLMGVAESRVNQFDAADNYFDRAQSVPKGALGAELPYWRGRRYLLERRTADAQVQLGVVTRFGSTFARTMAATLQSGIFIQSERYFEAARTLMSLLELLESDEVDLEAWIWSLHSLASLAREVDFPQIRSFIKSRAQRDVWPAEFALNKFQTQKAVAWCCALEGDYFNAFRLLKSAAASAPTGAWSAMTCLDRAYLARCVNERRWSRDELNEAENILARVDWHNASNEETVALLIAAELFAAVDPSRALNYLSQFSELPPALNPLLHFRTDRRLQAQADYTTALVQLELGNRAAAVAGFKKSWAIQDEIRFDWRAGRTAIRLYETTGERRWLDRAKEKLRNYGASWLHDDLSRYEKNDALSALLTPAQEHIFRLLCEGRSTAEMCALTGRSHFTIRNHIKAILKAFAVENRSALLAEAARRGLLA